ncbi:hypothetical protein [Nitrospira lenta]|uniref:Uncharacterized protein n=1 Tax=Nitrospira lenta TaxID=1436998 RepID=A0A330L186_9BACT|nr:hypothetical protein [Nitrospira lenta]SPP63019.1 exported hypothetical protein [Nitrospira lenta]
MTHRRRRSILALGVVWLLIADVATAGEYVLVLGKGIEVCEAFLKNLNSFPGDPPMVCERKVNPKFPEFSKPTWQPLDALKHLDLIEQIERWKPYETGFEDPNRREEILTRIKERIANGDIRLATIELDIEQDGVSETVLKYEYAGCDPSNESHFSGTSGRSFYVLTSDKTKLDKEKSGNFAIALRADMFLFNSRPYITVWAGNPGFKNGLLSIYRPFSLVGTQPGRCDYRYKAAKTRRQS